MERRGQYWKTEIIGYWYIVFDIQILSAAVSISFIVTMTEFGFLFEGLATNLIKE